MAALSPTTLSEVERRLREQYGQPRHHNPQEPLDDLVFVVLSRMTQEVKYLRTYRALRERMPTWGQVRDARVEELEEVLEDAGLAPTKARALQAILKEVESREGCLDLSHLRSLPDDAVEDYLTSLPGVAAKTARCVMLYALGRDTCPVDAHVWRIAQRLGIAPVGLPWNERCARELEDRIPRSLRASLHVTLVAHGREVCLARSPRCGECVLVDLCPSAVVAVAKEDPMPDDTALPPAPKLMPHVMKAIEAKGGVATNQEIEEAVAAALGLSPEEASRPHGELGESGRTELGYRVAWARTRLKRDGKIINRSKGVWAIPR